MLSSPVSALLRRRRTSGAATPVGLTLSPLSTTAGVWPAITVALAWTYGALAWRRVTGRPLSGVLVLAAGVLTLRTLVAFLAGSPFLYFLQPVLSDFVLGGAFLVTLFTARPAVARIAPDFFPLDEEQSGRPAVRRLFLVLTGLGGTVFLTKAAVMLCLLLAASLDTYVLVRSISMPSANGLCVAATIALAGLVVRREGLSRPAVLPHLPGGAFDMIYIDPPFNPGRPQARATLRAREERDT